MSEMTAPEGAPWTLPQVAAFVREDQRTTRRRVARGDLPVVTLPHSRRLLFNPDTVRAFVDANVKVRV
jgi:hypothetical protein